MAECLLDVLEIKVGGRCRKRFPFKVNLAGHVKHSGSGLIQCRVIGDGVGRLNVRQAKVRCCAAQFSSNAFGFAHVAVPASDHAVSSGTANHKTPRPPDKRGSDKNRRIVHAIVFGGSSAG